jgi:hypothetical protein
MMIFQLFANVEYYSDQSNHYFYTNLLCLIVVALSKIYYTAIQTQCSTLYKMFSPSIELRYKYFLTICLLFGTTCYLTIHPIVTIIQHTLYCSHLPKHSYHPKPHYSKRPWILSHMFPKAWCLLSSIMLSTSTCAQLYFNNFHEFRRIKIRTPSNHLDSLPADYYIQAYNDFLQSPYTDGATFLANPPASLLHLTGFGDEFVNMMRQHSATIPTIPSSIPEPKVQPSLIRMSSYIIPMDSVSSYKMTILIQRLLFYNQNSKLALTPFKLFLILDAPLL